MPKTAPRLPHEIFREACQIAHAKGMFILKEGSGEKTDYIICRRLPNGRSTRLTRRGSVTALHRYVVSAAQTK